MAARSRVLGPLRLLPPPRAAVATPEPRPAALRTDVKMMVSLGNEVVCSFMRLNIYADLGEGNLVPCFTMNNILLDWWTATGDDQYEMRKYGVGYYTRFDGHEPLKPLDNPVTGQSDRIHQCRLGPVPRLYTPDGVIVMGFKPEFLPIEVIGDRVLLATQSIEAQPDAVHAGRKNYVNSLMTMPAVLADVANGAVVPRWVPEVFDTKNWTEFVFEETEYLRERLACAVEVLSGGGDHILGSDSRAAVPGAPEGAYPSKKYFV